MFGLAKKTIDLEPYKEYEPTNRFGPHESREAAQERYQAERKARETGPREPELPHYLVRDESGDGSNIPAVLILFGVPACTIVAGVGWLYMKAHGG